MQPKIGRTIFGFLFVGIINNQLISFMERTREIGVIVVGIVLTVLLLTVIVQIRKLKMENLYL